MLKASPFSLITSESWYKDWLWTLFAKLIIAVFIPFFADEAYYWVWSQSLQLSYFDHPPMVAWLFNLGSPFISWGSASRWPFIIISHLTLFVWCFFLAKSLASYQKRTLFWLLLLHPLVGLGGFVANPDVPFLFFWSLSLVFYFQSLSHPEKKLWPAGLGLTMGLGFCSKYLMVLILPVLVFHLLISDEWKKLRLFHIWITFLVGLFTCLPVLIWNYQNDWASISFQLSHGLGKSQWQPKWTSDFLMGTLILLFPPFAFYFLKNFIKFKKNFHVLSFIVLLSFFIWTTFRGDTELNWPVVMYPSFLFALTLFNIKNLYYKSFHVFFGFLFVFLLAGTLGLWGSKIHGRLTEGLKYSKIFSEVRDLSPLYTSTYQTASYFWYLSKSPYMKLRSSSRPDHFDYLKNSVPTEDTFYFLKEQYQIIPEVHLSNYQFSRIRNLSGGFELFEGKKIK